ncbi:hypothetical protein M8818_000290 [Zalaria obscura]|uniref:Uncharacterized protein n=1 Tax=Zalaria obscura TaxID=2024903 RepID=A0ACC3SSB6_9PEZI
MERHVQKDEDFHSLSGNEPDCEDEVASLNSDLPPVHPVPIMQDAFEESIRESAEETNGDDTPVTGRPNAEARRADLLEQEAYDDSWNTRWKQKPGAKSHPIMKLMAQIVFGMHLLHQQQAKSDAEVVKILQTHVDEVDGFLEKTTEDFDLAIRDIDERIRYLTLPMTHRDVFDIMLDDKQFRTQLIDGNEKIEKIIERTAKAMNAALQDVEKGITSTTELGKYLDSVKFDWPHDRDDLGAIFAAMRGNEEGWLSCLRDLQMKANKLGVSLVQLGTVIGEMDKLAAAASRRNKVSQFRLAQDHRLINGKTQSRISTTTTGTHAPLSKYSSTTQKKRSISNGLVDKPLPRDPDSVEPAVQATLRRSQSGPLDRVMQKQRASSVPMPDRYDGTRRTVPPPTRANNDPPSPTHSDPGNNDRSRNVRVKKMTPREPISPKGSETAELAAFLRASGPLQPQPQPRTAARRSAKVHTPPDPLNNNQGPLNPLSSNPPVELDSTPVEKPRAPPFKVRGAVAMPAPTTPSRTLEPDTDPTRASLTNADDYRQPIPSASPHPDDSAYASSTDAIHPSHSHTTQQPEQAEPALAPRPSISPPSTAGLPRTPSRLGLFPSTQSQSRSLSGASTPLQRSWSGSVSTPQPGQAQQQGSRPQTALPDLSQRPLPAGREELGMGVGVGVGVGRKRGNSAFSFKRMFRRGKVHAIAA